MASYTQKNPLTLTSVGADGTIAGQVRALGRSHYMSDERVPAFVGLARATGGFYAENPEGMTIDAALEAADLDFTVQFEEITSNVGGPHGGRIAKYRQRGTVAVYRDGRDPVGLGTVRDAYQLVQNRDVGELGQVVIDEGGANIVAAGAYGDPVGAQTYMAFRLPEGMTVGGEDPYDLHLTFLNSFNYSSSLWVLLAPIRLACTNMTVATFQKAVNRIQLRHTGAIKVKLAEARKALELASDWTTEWQKEAEELLRTEVPDREIDSFLDALMRSAKREWTTSRGWPERRQDIHDVITNSPANEFGRGTAYAVYNGVTEWLDWERDVRTTDAIAGSQRRYIRTLDGDEELIKITAADLLLAA